MEANPGRMITFTAQQHHIRHVNCFLTFYYTRLSNLTHRLGMPFDKVDALDQHPSILGMSRTHLAFLTLVLAGNNQHGIVLSNFHRRQYIPFQSYLAQTCCLYKTSGANEIILVKFFSLSSLATGPNMRVPLGLFWSVRITAAFSSNLMDEPSGRR